MTIAYVYILANFSRGLYHGFTIDLPKRVQRHKRGRGTAFTRKYRIHRLVYFETYLDVRSALIREKELKRWPRERKIRLIERHNPDWRDLSVDWVSSRPGPSPPPSSSWHQWP